MLRIGRDGKDPFGNAVEAIVWPGHMRTYSRLLSATENESPTSNFSGSCIGSRSGWSSWGGGGGGKVANVQALGGVGTE